jgi:hypothetical protein
MALEARRRPPRLRGTRPRTARCFHSSIVSPLSGSGASGTDGLEPAASALSIRRSSAPPDPSACLLALQVEVGRPDEHHPVALLSAIRTCGRRRRVGKFALSGDEANCGLPMPGRMS